VCGGRRIAGVEIDLDAYVAVGRVGARTDLLCSDAGSTS
jgi:hypothetical protein